MHGTFTAADSRCTTAVLVNLSLRLLRHFVIVFLAAVRGVKLCCICNPKAVKLLYQI
jgi:hypothetical protein